MRTRARMTLGVAGVGLLVVGCSVSTSRPNSTRPTASTTSAGANVPPTAELQIPVVDDQAGVTMSNVSVAPLLEPGGKDPVHIARRVDGRLREIATITAGASSPVAMIEDGSLTSRFGRRARHFMTGPAADLSCPSSAITLEQDGLTVWSTDPLPFLDGLGDVLRNVDGQVEAGPLPPEYELISEPVVPAHGWSADYDVRFDDTDLHVSARSQSATTPGGCGPWTSVTIGATTAVASAQGAPMPIGAAAANVSWQAGPWTSVTVSGGATPDVALVFARSSHLIDLQTLERRWTGTTTPG